MFRFRYFKHYRWAPWLYEQMESCDVIVMIHALHYGWPVGKDEFYQDTTAAIAYLVNFTASSEKRVAIWRSALPQHFDTPTGHYLKNSKCIAIKEEYLSSQENNAEQEYNQIYNQIFSELCSTENSSCGDAKLRCTVKTNAEDIFSVYSYWVANNLIAEMEHAKQINPTYPNATGTILRWELFDLFNVLMWHFDSKLIFFVIIHPFVLLKHLQLKCIAPAINNKKNLIDGDCSHFCYVPALYEEAFHRLDLLLSLTSV